MVKNHLSRLNAPKSWPIKRKGIKFIIKPQAGAHNLDDCISLSLVLRNLLKYAKTAKEVRIILNDKSVLVNGKVRKDPSLSVGVMDVISFPTLKEHYLLLINTKGKFKLMKIDEKLAQTKLYKIENKCFLKKGKVQLNFFSGSNMIVDKDEYKTGDCLVMNMKDNQVVDHLKFDKGVNVYIIKGKRAGMFGKLLEFKSLREGKDNIVFEVDGEKYETSKEYAFAVGDMKLENE